MDETMRAYRLLQAGEMPEVVEVAIPEPGPGQLRLRMAAAGLCHSDLLVIHAKPSYFPLPMTMGHEATGWVDALGAGVTNIQVGDAYGIYFPWGCGRCTPCATGAENLCVHSAVTPGFATGHDGGMAEYILVDDPRHLVPLGDLDPVAAAPLMCAGITAYHAVTQSIGRLAPGSTAVIIGVGGLGHLAVQIIKAITPARIICIDNQPAKLEHALQLGADATYLVGPDLREQVRAATRGLGADVVLDFVGNDHTLPLASAVLAQGGVLEIIGVGGGTLPVRFHEMPRDCHITLPYAGTIGDLRGVVNLLGRGLLQPDVIPIGFDQLNETYKLMDTGRLKGRAVLVP